MAKARLLLAEIEGPDEAVSAAIRSFLSASQIGTTPPISLAQIPAPVADSPAAALPASAPAAASPGPVKPRRKARRIGKATAASASLAGAAAQPEDSGCTTAILAALAKGPCTSADLVKLTKYSSGSVYPALQRLRESSRIEMIDDESDGQRKNKLKA